MNWNYREGVHATVVGRDLVLLDLVSDAYFCLTDLGPLDPDVGWNPGRLPAEVISSLREGELVEEAELAPRARPLPPRPESDLRGLQGSLSPSALARAVIALRAFRRTTADPSVSELLQLIRRPGRHDRRSVHRAAADFDAVLPLLPGEFACLQRSALLMLVLQAHGLSAQWVFGVRTWPFRAHCWVQRGDVCLNDHHEHLRGYTPILAVGSNYMSDIV